MEGGRVGEGEGGKGREREGKGGRKEKEERGEVAWYPVQRKSAWYTLMRFRLIKSGVLTFMTFTLFRGVFSDKIYVPTWLI